MHLGHGFSITPKAAGSTTLFGLILFSSNGINYGVTSGGLTFCPTCCPHGGTFAGYPEAHQGQTATSKCSGSGVGTAGDKAEPSTGKRKPLGHATFVSTLEDYSRLLPCTHAEAAARVERLGGTNYCAVLRNCFSARDEPAIPLSGRSVRIRRERLESDEKGPKDPHQWWTSDGYFVEGCLCFGADCWEIPRRCH